MKRHGGNLHNGKAHSTKYRRLYATSVTRRNSAQKCPPSSASQINAFVTNDT